MAAGCVTVLIKQWLQQTSDPDDVVRVEKSGSQSAPDLRNFASTPDPAHSVQHAGIRSESCLWLQRAWSPLLHGAQRRPSPTKHKMRSRQKCRSPVRESESSLKSTVIVNEQHF